MQIEFAIRAWAAYAPELETPSQWLQWAAQSTLPTGDQQPDLGEMAPLLRRRLGPLGRTAAKAAYDCQESAGIPIVFASRYGDAARSIALLKNFSVGEAVSPTDFTLSVHNAIGGVYSIAQKDRGNFTTVSAGSATAAAAVIEAAGLLSEEATEVMVVCYEAPLPGEYSAFGDEAPALYAWAWRLGRPAPGQPYMSLESQPLASEEEQAPELPFGLDVFRFALSADDDLRRQAEGINWIWRRHD
jgi:hypothetical protein